MQLVDPSLIAEKYLREIQSAVQDLDGTPNVVGFIASEDKPSRAYASATKRAFTEVGFSYDLRHVQRLSLEDEILKANDDPAVHGIFVYFPVFNSQEDTYLRNLVDYTKDIEAGSLYWTRKMSANDRKASEDDPERKALLPCTPLAIVKLLDDIGVYGEDDQPAAGHQVTIFNRSEVIGRPLAVMMSNDGAEVISFDENGPLRFQDGKPVEVNIDRKEALKRADIVITGVPSDSFELISASELRRDAVCINFSSIPNFDKEVPKSVRTYVPRVGPMTVAMCMRNTIRLYENFHQ